MKKLKVLVTGSRGQLGKEIQLLADSHQNIVFFFTDVDTLDITNRQEVDSFFDEYTFDFCINCAAYTAVDRAEADKEQVYAVNIIAVKNIAENCKKHKVTLVHISTDFVFDGKSTVPYKENDQPKPINYYGETKLLGEIEVSKLLEQFFIIRTSWLYGRSGNNFVKTMLKLAKLNSEIKVVADQIGAPTYAKDLAAFILHLIVTENNKFGIYHFSNKGEISWYDFAKEIFKLTETTINLKRITTEEFPSIAKRPKYSKLDLSKTLKETNFEIRNWQEALKDYIKDDSVKGD